MMKKILIILPIIFQSVIYGQLGAKTKTEKDGSTITTCYHKNGHASTIETWDGVHRWGNITVYNNNGKEILNYGLRKIGGHASIYLTYYSNGQVKRAEFSSMPDGGIQWERYIHEFDENGTQTGYMDLSFDSKPEMFVFPDTLKKQEVVVKVEPKNEEIINWQTTRYQIVNTTKKDLTITISATDDHYFSAKDTTIKIAPKQTIILKTFTNNNFFLEQNIFNLSLIKAKRKKEKYTTIVGKPAEDVNILTYSWYVIEDH